MTRTYPVLLLLALLTNLTLAPLDSRLCVIAGRDFAFPPPNRVREEDGCGPLEDEEAAEPSGGEDAARTPVIGIGIGGLAGIWKEKYDMSRLFKVTYPTTITP